MTPLTAALKRMLNLNEPTVSKSTVAVEPVWKVSLVSLYVEPMELTWCHEGTHL